MMPLNQPSKRMVGKCFDIGSGEGGGAGGGVCVCVRAHPLLKEKQKPPQPSVYLAVSFNLCLACKREIHLQVLLAVNVLHLY